LRAGEVQYDRFRGGERIPSGGEKSFHGRPRIFTAGNGKIGEEGYWVGMERVFLSFSIID